MARTRFEKAWVICFCFGWASTYPSREKYSAAGAGPWKKRTTRTAHGKRIFFSNLSLGKTREATAAAEYAVATYPQNMEFRAYLGALRSAAGEEYADSLLEATPWASALSDSLKTVICQQQLR